MFCLNYQLFSANSLVYHKNIFKEKVEEILNYFKHKEREREREDLHKIKINNFNES